jgi:hypothetical protein
MYKVMSSYYGQMTAKQTLEDAIYRADCLKIKAHSDEVITVWKDGVTLYTAK